MPATSALTPASSAERLKRLPARATEIGSPSGSSRLRATARRASSTRMPPTSTPATVTPSAITSSREES